MTKITIVDVDMNTDSLFCAMRDVSTQKLTSVRNAVRTVVEERTAFEAVRERRLADGSVVTGQSADIRHVQALAESESFLRMVAALGVNPRAYIFPQSQADGKRADQTSNLKAYKKAREVAECIYTGSGTLENVARVFTVCAFRAVHNPAVRDNVLPRDYAECFLNSPEFRSIRTGAQSLFDAIEDVRAKHMSTGAQTQASQMIRTLVALNAAEDVRNGRAKDVRINPQALVMQALMTRFGQTVPEAVAEIA